MSAAGENDRPGRPRQLIALGVVAVVVAATVTLSLVNDSRSEGHDSVRPGQNSSPSPGQASTGPLDVGTRDARAIDVLAEQEYALARQSQATYLATWDASSRSAQRQAESTYTNLRALGVRRVDTRYIASDVGGLTSAEQRQIGGTAWTADVDVAWRLEGVDRSEVHTTLTYTFVQRDDKVAVVSIDRSGGDREPIWLLGPLAVRRSERTLVAAVSHAEADRVSRDLKQAVVDVNGVLPRWRGDLVAYVPADTGQLEDLLAATPGSYDGIAAVTTTVDGSRERGAPVAIVVNPRVFDRLGPIGSHVVITHESTHVATNAAAVTMPLWVAEGFADYVGVGSVDVPLSVSAAAVLRDVRQNGLPDRLPDNAAFSGSEGSLEVAYEEAWLAARMIAWDYGQRQLVTFYQDVLDDPTDVARALHDNLRVTTSEFTNDWRRYLKDLAHAR